MHISVLKSDPSACSLRRIQEFSPRSVSVRQDSSLFPEDDQWTQGGKVPHLRAQFKKANPLGVPGWLSRLSVELQLGFQAPHGALC